MGFKWSYLFQTFRKLLHRYEIFQSSQNNDLLKNTLILTCFECQKIGIVQNFWKIFLVFKKVTKLRIKKTLIFRFSKIKDFLWVSKDSNFSDILKDIFWFIKKPKKTSTKLRIFREKRLKFADSSIWMTNYCKFQRHFDFFFFVFKTTQIIQKTTNYSRINSALHFYWYRFQMITHFSDISKKIVLFSQTFKKNHN